MWTRGHHVEHRLLDDHPQAARPIFRSSADSAIASERIVTLFVVMPIAFDHSCELVVPRGPPFQERSQLAVA